jgi:hypothetical protein
MMATFYLDSFLNKNKMYSPVFPPKNVIRTNILNIVDIFCVILVTMVTY